MARCEEDNRTKTDLFQILPPLPAIGLSVCSSYALALPLNGRKFGNSFLQFSDATLEIGPGVVTPFFAGLRASIEPHILFGKILKNLELDRTKGNRHPDYGVKRPTKEFLADEFTVELEHAWVTVYGMIADTMIEAAEN